MLHSLIKFSLRIIAWRPDLNLIVTLMAGLCLIYKVEDLWTHRTLINWEETSLVSQAMAEAPKKEEQAKNVQKESESKQPEETSSKKEEFDPLMLDENQIKILQAMSKKEGDTTLADDRAKIVQQEALVNIAKEKLNKQIEHLEAIQKDIKSTTNDLTKKEQENVERMVKIYEAMKPLQAAEIMNKLELTALSEIFKAMTPKKASMIMSSMDHQKVRLVTLVMLKDEKAQLALKAKEDAEQKAQEKAGQENQQNS
jgi:flagellar motility protein MotE (MotC chaperone)